MNVCGIDPGTQRIGIVQLVGDDLRLHVVHGKVPPRKSKKNPHPTKLNPLYEMDLSAHRVVDSLTTSLIAVIGIESAAISANGRQDALAGCRQAIFTRLAMRVGAPIAAKMVIPITPGTAKKALTDYNGSDKKRMVQAARDWIRTNHPGKLAEWDTYGDKDREALADALGVMLAIMRVTHEAT